jgi:pimeloyl-ACP methyl ester carboxylesterase
VVWGGCDYVLPVGQAQAAVNLLPRGRLAVLPDCGHLPHVENPVRFAAVLAAWYAEHGDLAGDLAEGAAAAESESWSV